MGTSSFWDRFVHPYVAMAATLGVLIWFLDFLVAAAGLVYIHLFHDAATGGLLLAASGPFGLLGIGIVVLCAVYLVIYWVLRDVLGVIEGTDRKPGV